MSKVSIITVNYNQMQVTMDLLSSIGSYDASELEVIVVDNASKLDETALLALHYPHVRVIRSEINLGFAGGNNLGINAATGAFLFLINNDTILPKGTVPKLKEILEQRPEVAIVCPLIYYHDDPELIQYAGFTAINPLTGRNRALGFKKKLPITDNIKETEYAHGAAMMIKKSVVDQLGMMAENYFLYYEELDWVHQIKQAGYKVMVDHRSHIYHRESISTGKASPLKTYFQTRNRILFMRRNFHGLDKLLFYMFFALLAMPKHLLVSILKGNWPDLRSFVQGVKWNLLNSTKSDKLGYIYDELRYN